LNLSNNKIINKINFGIYVVLPTIEPSALRPE